MSDPERWDALAARYHWQEPLEHRGWSLALSLARPAREDRVVDLGCGPGTLGRRLARRPDSGRPRRLVGVDSSPAMLARARVAGETPVRATAGAVPLPDAWADLVVCGWLLHLLAPGPRRSALAEVARLVSPGGRAVLLVPAAPATGLGRLVRRVTTRAAGSDVLRVPVGIDAYLATAGFVVTAAERTRPGPGYATLVIVAAPRTPPRSPPRR